MSNCVLIDVPQLRVAKVAPTLRQAEYWARILFPNTETRIQTSERAGWSYFTNLELIELYISMKGPSGALGTYSEVMKRVIALAEQQQVDNTPEPELIEKLGYALDPLIGATSTSSLPDPTGVGQFVDNSEVGEVAAPVGATKATKPAKAPKTPKPPKDPNAPKAEKGSGKTAMVHTLSDQLLAKHKNKIADMKAFKAELLVLTKAQGLNDSTVSVQFGKWKNHKGF